MEEKDKEKWDLSREKIEERIRKSNEEWRKKGATRGGRSSGQGVKLLYIRDYLYHHATKEHPQNANRIQEFLTQHDSPSRFAQFKKVLSTRR